MSDDELSKLNLTDWLETDVPRRIPILPLVSTVLFPGGVLSLQVGIESNVAMIRDLPEDQEVVAVFAQKSGSRENPDPDDLSEIGVIAMIVQRLPLARHRYQIFLQGRQRVRRKSLFVENEFFLAEVEPVVPPELPSDQVEQLTQRSLSLFERLVETDRRYNEELLEVLMMNRAEGADLFADLLASFVPDLTLEQKQELLEMTNPLRRIEALVGYMRTDLGRAHVDLEVEREIQGAIKRRERESYLREQLRVIQQELGEGEGDQEIDHYQKRIEALPIGSDDSQHLLREVNRLRILSPASSDYAVIRGHLDTVLAMPWSESSDSVVDLAEAERILEERHYGLGKVKDRVLEFLAVLKLKGDLRGPILCFVGPPGVGKTSLGIAIAEALGRKFVRLSVGGITDESEIRGHRKTYIGAMPGKIINSYVQVGVNNPLIMIDEIDKLGKDYRGDPSSALLEVLDPEQNSAFVDRYLEVPFDLSHTLFVANANTLDGIPSPLMDRMEVIRIAGYTREEKLEIARRHLVPRILHDHGVASDGLTIDDGAIRNVIAQYTAEAGLRNLSQRLATIVRKIARRIAEDGETASFRVEASDLEDYLGLPQFEHEFAERQPEIGVTTGLAWTSFGGEIMFIEATMMPGTGRITVTGHLGEVMRESVQAAHSYVRSKAHELEIDEKRFAEYDIHIHFPAGAIPKDGPSAGVAIATTIASIAGEKPVRHDIGMSGEITLRGKVLSVGGIKEKVLAAQRAQIRTVVLPEGNRKDLSEVPEEVKEQLEFIFVKRVEEVWKEALIPLYVVRDGGRKFDLQEFEAEIGKGGPSTR